MSSTNSNSKFPTERMFPGPETIHDNDDNDLDTQIAVLKAKRAERKRRLREEEARRQEEAEKKAVELWAAMTRAAVEKMVAEQEAEAEAKAKRRAVRPEDLEARSGQGRIRARGARNAGWSVSGRSPGKSNHASPVSPRRPNAGWWRRGRRRSGRGLWNPTTSTTASKQDSTEWRRKWISS